MTLTNPTQGRVRGIRPARSYSERVKARLICRLEVARSLTGYTNTSVASSPCFLSVFPPYSVSSRLALGALFRPGVLALALSWHSFSFACFPAGERAAVSRPFREKLFVAGRPAFLQ